jgi:hypothetical protein
VQGVAAGASVFWKLDRNQIVNHADKSGLFRPKLTADELGAVQVVRRDLQDGSGPLSVARGWNGRQTA